LTKTPANISAYKTIKQNNDNPYKGFAEAPGNLGEKEMQIPYGSIP
jgi:hypothetical protein